MTFAIFVTWVIVGVLAGVLAGLAVKHGGHGVKRDVTLGLAGSIGAGVIVRMLGIYSGDAIVAVGVLALVGAVLPIAGQRWFWPTERVDEPKTDMWWRWGLGAGVVAVVVWMTVGPAQQPAAIAAVIEERTYAVTPATLKLKAGIMTGEVVELKVTERIEKGSDRVTTPARLTGTLRLKNASADQTVRLIEGKILYIDAQGQPIKLEDARTEPVLKFSMSGGERLDPGQDTTQSLDVEFPAEALKAKKLKDIRLEFAYIPSPYREQTVNIPVSINAGK